MIRNIAKFLLVILVTIVIGIAGKFLMSTSLGEPVEKVLSIPASVTATQSVYVTDEKGNVQKNSFLGSMITVGENNMTVTGTAKINCMVDIEEDVDTVIVEDLQQNGHDISINIMETDGCKIIFKGDNEIYDIFCDGPLIVEGADETAQLALTNSIYASELNITSGQIITPQLYSDGVMTIKGDSRVYLKQMEDQEDEFIYARLEAYDKVIIDLTGGGFVDIEGDLHRDLYSAFSTKGFEFGESTVIALPENGYAGLWDPEYDDEYCIMDENGEDTDKVVIKAVE